MGGCNTRKSTKQLVDARAQKLERCLRSSASLWLQVREFGQRAQVNLAGVPFEAGHYTLMNGENAIAAIGLNQDRAESDHRAWDVAEFEAAWNALHGHHAHPRWNEFDVARSSNASSKAPPCGKRCSSLLLQHLLPKLYFSAYGNHHQRRNHHRPQRPPRRKHSRRAHPKWHDRGYPGLHTSCS